MARALRRGMAEFPMDIPPNVSPLKRRIRRVSYALGGILVISRLKPAAPTVERGTVWVDAVKRGSMLRQVRGLGTLVPVEIRWIPAATDGRVERRLVLPGALRRPARLRPAGEHDFAFQTDRWREKRRPRAGESGAYLRQHD